MKLSEISQYWATKEFATFEESKDGISINAPFGAKDFTIKMNKRFANPVLHHNNEIKKLSKVADTQLTSNSFIRDKGVTIACFDLPKGKSELRSS